MSVITVADLTSKTVGGDGVFDTLMEAVKAHLVQEYKGARIKGSEYATVYLGSLTEVLARSTEFLLTKDKVALELELLEIQKETLAIEKEKVANERDLVAAQVRKVNAEVNLAIFEKDRIEAQTDLLKQQKLNAERENSILAKQLLKLDADILLSGNQAQKVLADKALIDQKKITEVAQVNGQDVAPHSAIGYEMLLRERQADGFLRDAEQKASNIMSNIWSVQRSTDNGFTVDGTGFTNTEIGRVIERLRQGVGAN